MKMIVVSLFDGKSGARLSLKNAGKVVDKYYASEINPDAIAVSDSNFSDIIRVGDVTKWKEWDIDWQKVDLLVGGSPCQGFSRAGKELNFEDERSKLFFVFVEILNHAKASNPKLKFMLENVTMNKEFSDVITKFVGVEPITINGKDGYLQSRPRMYWFNFEKKGIYTGAYKDISEVLSATGFEEKKLSDNLRVKGITENKRGVRAHRGDVRKTGISELGRVLNPDAQYCDTITTGHAPKIITRRTDGDIYYRKATIGECELLSGLPVGYTRVLSHAKALKCIGNGWHCGITTDIFSAL